LGKPLLPAVAAINLPLFKIIILGLYDFFEKVSQAMVFSIRSQLNGSTAKGNGWRFAIH
jgi:hypothetical protein